MKYCSFPLFVLSIAPLAFSQAPATATAPASTSTSSTQTVIKPRGPEAVADRDPNRIVATLNGKQITAKQALEMLKPFPPDQRKQYESNLPNLIQQIYLRMQLADQAVKMNLEQQSPWKDQIALSRENVLAQAYLSHLSDDAAKGPVEDTKAYYDAHPDEFEKAKLSGIFVGFMAPGTPAPTGGDTGKTQQQAEDKANEIEKKLKAGGDFAAIARTDSDNQAAASKGGDLGMVDLGDPKLPPVLKTAIAKLQPGQYSEPVRLQNQFLILKVESREKTPYADVQASLAQRLKTEKGQNIVKAEIDKYKIKVEDPDFFEAPGAKNIPTLQRPAPAAAQPSTPK